jgi:hypothetical protein
MLDARSGELRRSELVNSIRLMFGFMSSVTAVVCYRDIFLPEARPVLSLSKYNRLKLNADPSIPNNNTLFVIL